MTELGDIIYFINEYDNKVLPMKGEIMYKENDEYIVYTISKYRQISRDMLSVLRVLSTKDIYKTRKEVLDAIPKYKLKRGVQESLDIEFD